MTHLEKANALIDELVAEMSESEIPEEVREDLEYLAREALGFLDPAGWGDADGKRRFIYHRLCHYARRLRWSSGTVITMGPGILRRGGDVIVAALEYPHTVK